MWNSILILEIHTRGHLFNMQFIDAYTLFWALRTDEYKLLYNKWISKLRDA